jgi:hypothetical protein
VQRGLHELSRHLIGVEARLNERTIQQRFKAGEYEFTLDAYAPNLFLTRNLCNYWGERPKLTQ